MEKEDGRDHSHDWEVNTSLAPMLDEACIPLRAITEIHHAIQVRLKRLNEELKGCEAQIHSGISPEERCSLIETLLVSLECATPTCFMPQNDLLKRLIIPEA